MIDPTATDHCSEGIRQFVRWQASAMGHIDAAIAADDQAALPQLVKAWMLIGGRDAQFSETTSTLADEAQSRLCSHNECERRLHTALRSAQAGQGVEAATELQILLHSTPTDILVHQLIQNELFWMGRADWMRDVTEHAADAWSQNHPDYGPYLSLRAFASEEAGYLADAERYGRAAVEINPADVWGAHAVAHVPIHSTPVAPVGGVGRTQILMYVPCDLLPHEHDRRTVNSH